MQVKCDYCGSWMDDGDANCPNCGAVNANLKKTVEESSKSVFEKSDNGKSAFEKSDGEKSVYENQKDTSSKKKSGSPRTIEELKAWYRDRCLPPYETTRFFIGINYEKPKAFGIYKDGDEFVVYKNKADGKRAVRYRGKDEAYAVNELYLRLKEEILNQKKGNKKRRSGKKKRRPSGCLGDILSWVRGGAIVILILGIIGFVGIQKEIRETQAYDYYVVGSDIYYYCGGRFSENEATGEYEYAYEWWKFDESTQDWYLYATLDDSDTFPEGIKYKNDVGSILDLAEKLGIEHETYDDLKASVYCIDSSHTYIDAHHHSPYESSYYVVDGVTYYYLYDAYGERYGSGNQSGWYKYDTDSGWEYYCDGDDRSTLGDDLWYDCYMYSAGDDYSEYTSGDVYNFTDEEASEWTAASEFEDTDWYEEYEESAEAHDEYVSEHPMTSSSSSSGDDSDYDWSSSDSWDSGSTDWSSDW